MSLALPLSFVISTTTGVLLLRLVWPREVARPWPVLVALGAGLGAGLSAVLFFLWLLAVGPTRGFPVAETGLLGLVVVASLRRGPTGGADSTTPPATGIGSRWRLIIVAAFLVTLVGAVGAFLSHLRQHPHGEWDAWMNWDLRARMIVRGGEQWRSAFSGLIPWSHPDYPVLVPSLVARTWLYAGTETLLGPALVAATFTFGTVALLVTTLMALRNGSQGLLAGLTLLSVPFFILHGTSLYADVPLGLFFLTTFVLLALDARYGHASKRFGILAGVAAGLAMWTKNEGILFTLAIGAGLLFSGLRGSGDPSLQRLRSFGIGLFPMVLLLAGFKLALAPPNDLLSTLDIERTLGRLTDPDRYFTVLRAYITHISSFGSNEFGSLFWVLAAYVLGLGVSRSESRRGWVKAGFTALALLLAGHFMVFVSMAHELSRLLASSLDRLLLQLAPSALFLFFMLVRTPKGVVTNALDPERAA
jgi:Dolichyl-phosphate-mannose-protein mannosyltransferase